MNDLKRLLVEDHALLERQLAQLAQAVEADDCPADLLECWTRFEAGLRDHLDTEERCLFPAAGPEHREQVEGLRAEHRRIRHTLQELGVALELHTLRKPSVDELITFLREHAEREKQTLYAWLEEPGNAGARHGLLAMFERRSKAPFVEHAEPVSHVR